VNKGRVKKFRRKVEFFSSSEACNMSVKSCAQVALLDETYFADLTWKAQSPVATAANAMIVVGETISLVLAIPFILAGSLFAGLLKGFMPLFVLFVSLFRMLLRPALGLITDVTWAQAHNYTHRVALKKTDQLQHQDHFDNSAVAVTPHGGKGFETV
jgi:hypothetical protein